VESVEGRAPGRICLLGDNADLIEKPALAAAISAFLSVRLRMRRDRQVILIGEDLGLRETLSLDTPFALEGRLKYLRAVHRRLAGHITCGYEAVVASQIPISAGLSSSTALCIASIRALAQAFDFALSAAEIAELSFVIEKDDLDIECGRMDQYAIAFGGVTYIQTGEGAGVEKLAVPSLPIVVADTQEQHDTRELQKWLRRRIEQRDPVLLGSLGRVVEIVERGRQALIAGDLSALGQLMSAQQVEEDLMGTSTERLRRYCGVARQAGALGAKQMGAGGGGCMIALCPGRVSMVKDALESAGGRVWAFDIYDET
jgi:mevalonate kinase